MQESKAKQTGKQKSCLPCKIWQKIYQFYPAPLILLNTKYKTENTKYMVHTRQGNVRDFFFFKLKEFSGNSVMCQEKKKKTIFCKICQRIIWEFYSY